MKKISLLCTSLIFLIFACGGDSEVLCDQENAENVFIGDWDEGQIGDLGDEVTFNADNTGSCANTSIFHFDPDFNFTTTDFTWSINSDNTVISISRNNFNTSEHTFTISDCDSITVNFDSSSGQPLLFNLVRQ